MLCYLFIVLKLIYQMPKLIYSFFIKNIFFVFCTIFTLFFTYQNNGKQFDLFILSVFLGIGILALYGIFLSADKKSVSLNKTFCMFYYFFFSLAPIVQFKNKSIFYFDGKIDNNLYLKSGVILLIVLILYLFFYRLLLHSLKINKSALIKKRASKINSIYLFYGVSIFSVLLYLFLIKFNWNLIIYRPFFYKLKYNTNLGLLGYAMLNVVKFIPFIVLVYYKLLHKNNDKNFYCLLFLFLLICFPTSLSRSFIGIMYIPLLLLFFPNLYRKKYYVALFMLGVLIVFPLLNNFRSLKEEYFNFSYELFNSGHFDAFQNFTLLLDENIITNGRQLLGSIFFFIQEENWVNRPSGTGRLLAEGLGYTNLNVSMPFFGEGYANWGFLGMFLFLLVIVMFNAFFDKIVFQRKSLALFYLFFLGFEFFLLRGDLFASIKIFTSFILAISFVECCFFLVSKIIKRR